MCSYLIGLRFSTGIAQTMAFVTLSMAELLRAFTARSLEKLSVTLGFMSNKWIVGSVLFSTVVTLLVVYFGGSIFKTTPLTPELLAVAVGLALIAPVLEDVSKLLTNKNIRKSELS